MSWQLSIWFFYTVGYDLFMLIVALTDGVYTSFSDISSYVVCLVTTYCVIVVDSYYEKVGMGRETAHFDGEVGVQGGRRGAREGYKGIGGNLITLIRSKTLGRWVYRARRKVRLVRRRVMYRGEMGQKRIV